jgi:uncharacterized protein DUF4349
MNIKKQFEKIKENWLIAVLLLVLLMVMSGGGSIVNDLSRGSFGGLSKNFAMTDSIESSAMMASRGYMPPMAASNFEPDAKLRKVIKTTSMSTEVERNAYKQEEIKLRSIVESSDSYILTENVRKYKNNKQEYYSGSYQIKIDTSKYDSIISQLKQIGEIKSFNENANDVTGSYTDTQIELESEKERLNKFNLMYNEATEVEDKIQLTDRIFNQERTVKYLEESIRNVDQKIEYSTVYFSMNEKQSEYANIAFVKLSELVRRFVSSVNSLFSLVFVLVPWLIGVFILGIAWKIYKKLKK